MSRAFVKEPDGAMVPDDEPDRPRSLHPNYVTPQGFKRLEARLSDLERKRDLLSATPDDPASQLALGQVERDIRHVAERIERAVIVDPKTQTKDQVDFGAVVTVADETGAAREFAIVGEDEADPEQGKVSWLSPLAQALRGGQVGDSVVWRRPAGDVALKIMALRYPET